VKCTFEKRSFLWALGAILVTGVCASSSQADMWTASGTGSDGALDAQATFTISDGQIQVTITNLLSAASIRSIGQSVSDLSFTISNAPGTNTSNTAAGQLANVDKNGNVTLEPGTPGRWVGLETEKIGKNKLKVLGGFNITGDTITLEAIGGNQPNELILPADIGGKYASAKGGGFDSHNFSTDGPATFTLDLMGVTSSTTITAVTFSFGTSPDTFLTGMEVPMGGGGQGGGGNTVPVPPSAVLLGFGFLAFGCMTWRRGALALAK
jgi:hypothetical protein